MDRAQIVHENFLARVAAADFPPATSHLSLAEAGLTKPAFVEIFRAQILSRQLDRTSRRMQARGEGYYTIGSSGHEGNAAIAAAFRLDDMAFLHYRDAAFLIARAGKLAGTTPAWDLMLSFAASAEDPISGGRHKVLGSGPLHIPPQTSTIASHLPKAVGAAYGIDLARHVAPLARQLPADGVILCSFGDASANHSTAQGAINTACWTAYQGIPLPLVFICEDNEIGISTRTPAGWIRAAFSNRPGLRYFACNGLDILDTFRTARRVQDFTRRTRKPAFLHMSCVRLYGHAGADAQNAYLGRAEIERAEANDPLLHSARLAVEHRILEPAEIIDIYQEIGATTERIARQVATRPRLHTARQVKASLIPPKRQPATTERPSRKARHAIFGTDFAAMEKPQPMARLLNWALTDLMLEHGEIVLAGEDIGPKGGVYAVTAKLHARFGAHRVINTLLDEQSILGLAIGLAHDGFLPIAEIQFLAYLHNAEDQLRGEAATLSFFSNGQYTNPMIVRIAGLGYQRGFGGHFHNDNSLAVLRDIPGLVIACPSSGADAVAMLRECVRLAREEQRVIAFIEPIALYMTRDLHEERDGLWSFVYPPPGAETPIGLGDVGRYGEGTDLAVLTYGNGHHLSRKAQKVLRETHGLDARIVDLRWLAPLDVEKILAALGPCANVLIVDECRATGSQSEALFALIAENSRHRPNIRRLAAEDCFIPLGPAATAPLPSVESITAAALDMLALPESAARPPGKA